MIQLSNMDHKVIYINIDYFRALQNFFVFVCMTAFQ